MNNDTKIMILLTGGLLILDTYLSGHLHNISYDWWLAAG
ncbi:hypothetical protein Barb6XT_02317 [Bacteroidales bacterium Barb6XT]|nr:hypothetical protein Barb6XT_02317 [Bacteroidales bacterium Barb6XT]